MKFDLYEQPPFGAAVLLRAKDDMKPGTALLLGAVSYRGHFLPKRPINAAGG